MQSSQFDSYMRRLPDWLQIGLALAFIAGLTVFKLTAGHSVTLIDFLFVPVVAVGWFAQRRWCGYLVAAVAATDSVVVAMIAETQASFPAAIGSAAARFVLYLFVLGLLGMMRTERAGHRHAVRTDRQTGAASSGAFREIAAAEVRRGQHLGLTLTLAYLDLDDFKAVNDAFGHDIGDRVLQRASHVMRSTVRASDTVARLGGDEFAVLMPDTGADAARKVVERVRGEMARLTLSDGRHVHFSIGLVTFIRPAASLQELTAAADGLMYQAKKSGKDRIAQAERAGSRTQGPLRGRLVLG